MTGECMGCGRDLATAPRGGARGMCSACYQRAENRGELGLADRPTLADFFELDLGWHEDALCAETDPEIFFPEKGGSTREGKAVCAKCHVRAECLDFALVTRQRFGIYGGTSERERRKLLDLAAADDEEAVRAA